MFYLQLLQLLKQLCKVGVPCQNDGRDVGAGEGYQGYQGYQVLAVDQKSRHFIKPVFHLLSSNILKLEDKAGLSKDIKNRITDYSNEKYNPATGELLTMATFLDPRFKATYMSPEQLEEAGGRAATEIKALEEKTATDASSTEGQSEGETGTAPPQKPKNSLGTLFKKCSSALPKQQGIDVEIDSSLLMVMADSV